MVAAEAGPGDVGAARRRRPGRGRAARHPAPARPRPPHRLAHLGPDRTGSRRRTASTAGARRSRRRAPRRPPRAGRRLERARRPRARPRAGRPRTSPPCSWPTTRWRSACCARCTRPGRRIPADISVVGFDDIPEAEYFTPPLTTVRQNFNEMGRRSLLLLLEQIESGSRAPVRETVPPELIVRASTTSVGGS